jgi:hypothetical protein
MACTRVQDYRYKSATKNFMMVVEVRDGKEAEKGSRH